MNYYQIGAESTVSNKVYDQCNIKQHFGEAISPNSQYIALDQKQSDLYFFAS